ncbi:hypothetical protein ACOMHN_019833 [Nucella lapillus]
MVDCNGKHEEQQMQEEEEVEQQPKQEEEEEEAQQQKQEEEEEEEQQMQEEEEEEEQQMQEEEEEEEHPKQEEEEEEAQQQKQEEEEVEQQPKQEEEEEEAQQQKHEEGEEQQKQEEEEEHEQQQEEEEEEQQMQKEEEKEVKEEEGEEEDQRKWLTLETPYQVEICFDPFSRIYLPAKPHSIYGGDIVKLWLARGETSGQVCISNCAHCQSLRMTEDWKPRRPELEHMSTDCKMVMVRADSEDTTVQDRKGTEAGQVMALGRVSIVDQVGKILLDTYVQPPREVVDYVTAFSGLTADHLKQGRPFREVQEEVVDILKGKILVIHDCRGDFEVLGYKHPEEDIRDTSNHPPLTNHVRQLFFYNRIALKHVE